MVLRVVLLVQESVMLLAVMLQALVLVAAVVMLINKLKRKYQVGIRGFED